ncbi:MAG: hypothetical protein IKZ04_06080 [Spirochaetaceae bacterium]|nr:hypothetical protein [Spirochaetaceae bacterium]
MQICKSVFTKKLFLTGILLIGCLTYLASIDFPSMPETSSPSMPEIGGSPFGPWNNSSRIPKPQPATAEQKDSVPKSAAGMALSAQNISDLGGLDALSGLGSKKDLLSNISSLSNIKGDESLSEVLQVLSDKNPSATGTSDETTNTMLSQILEQLQNLSAKQSSDTAEKQTDSAKTENAETVSRILRFNVNGFDILSSCRTIYFSEPEPNGVFLLTGDRTYYIDKQKHAETFYLLFKPRTSENGSFYYDVETDLVQNPETEGSKLYPFSQKIQITARRTGNLVSMRYNQTKWTLDILLDLKEHNK